MSLTDTPNGRLVTLSAQRCNTLPLRKRLSRVLATGRLADRLDYKALLQPLKRVPVQDLRRIPSEDSSGSLLGPVSNVPWEVEWKEPFERVEAVVKVFGR